jgi:hypothetical protein
VAKADRKNSTAALLSLEAEITSPCITEEAAAKAEEDIRKLTSSTFDPGFGEGFIHRLRRRWRSSVDFVEYEQQRAHLLNRLREISEENHRRASEEHRHRRAVIISDRNRQMAEEFLNKKSNQHSHRSDSSLKAKIGKDFDLNRSASIEAINRGLKSLGKQR